MCNDDLFTALPERIGRDFPALDSAIVAALPGADERYAELAGQKKEISGRFPNVDSWLEGEGPLSLSAEERAGIVEYLELTAQMEDIERMALYYAGHRDCFAYLKKIGAV